MRELLAERGVEAATRSVRFIASDYNEPLDVALGGFDLLVSLYAGFVSDACTPYLRIGGTLLVNPSHGDAAMASIDPRYRLRAVVTATSDDGYAVDVDDLDRHLVPKHAVEVTKELLLASGRGIPYTASPYAYLFERIS